MNQYRILERRRSVVRRVVTVPQSLIVIILRIHISSFVVVVW